MNHQPCMDGGLAFHLSSSNKGISWRRIGVDDWLIVSVLVLMEMLYHSTFFSNLFPFTLLRLSLCCWYSFFKSGTMIVLALLVSIALFDTVYGVRMYKKLQMPLIWPSFFHLYDKNKWDHNNEVFFLCVKFLAFFKTGLHDHCEKRHCSLI